MKANQMTCQRALLILISNADDATREEVSAARVHAGRCPRCNAAYDPTAPDLLALGVAAGDTRELATPLRVGLFAAAAAQLVLAIPWLVGKSLLPDSQVAVSHLTRDGALGLVIAALGLITVWRPRYVHSSKFVGLIVLGLQLVTGLTDRQMGSVTSSFELVHFLVLIIVLGLFAVAADLARRATPRAEARSRVPHVALHLAKTHSRPR